MKQQETVCVSTPGRDQMEMFTTSTEGQPGRVHYVIMINAIKPLLKVQNSFFGKTELTKYRFNDIESFLMCE